MGGKPILFSPAMVRALLAGAKTQTRRVIKPHKPHRTDIIVAPFVDNRGTRHGKNGQLFAVTPDRSSGGPITCPYGQPGDLLWVREGLEKAKEYGGIGYPADGTWLPNIAWKWKRDNLPAMHMPRALSRITLEIIDIRAQRLQDISEDDSKMEGAPAEFEMSLAEFLHGKDTPDTTHRLGFKHLWNSIHGSGSWDLNPWVWAVTFAVHQQNIDEFLKAKAAT